MKIFNGKKGVFAFRIDEDYIYPKETIAVHNVARKHDIKLSWFMNLEQGHKYPTLIKKLSKYHDIQSHGWKHQTFQGGKKSFESIKKAKDFLDHLNLRNVGYVPPFGMCSDVDHKNCETLGINYVSEFVSGNGVFPYALSKKLYNVPCHPMCLGVLLKLNYGLQNSIQYFLRIIDLFFEHSIPIFLYGHSNDRLGKYPQLLDSIGKKINTLPVWKTTLTKYHDYWVQHNLTHQSQSIITININNKRTPLTEIEEKIKRLKFLVRESFRMHIYDYDKKSINALK